MVEPDIAVLLLAGVIVFAGHLVKGVSGFGSALFAVPLLLLVLDVRFVTPLFVLFDLAAGALLVGSNWRFVDRRLLLLLFSGMLVGTGIGTWVLITFSHEILKRVLGVLVIAWALVMLFDREHRTASGERSWSPALAPVSGFLGGTLGAMFGISGPPIIIYLSQVLKERQAFRATLCGLFLAEACYKTVLFTANGLLDREAVCFALLMAPFLAAGVGIGSWLQRLLEGEVFRRIVAGILAVTGLILLI